jgi:hypothetical protein
VLLPLISTVTYFNDLDNNDMVLFYCDAKTKKVFILDKLDFTNGYLLDKIDFYYSDKDTIILTPRSATCNKHKAMNIVLLVALLLGLKTSAGIFSAAAFSMNFLSNIPSAKTVQKACLHFLCSAIPSTQLGICITPYVNNRPGITMIK